MSEQMPTAEDIELLRGLVAIPSVNPDERAAVTYLCERMAARGFLTHTDGVGNAIGTVGDGPAHIVLLGHIDTVPGQIPVRVTDDGLLYGRGSVDAKGPLATFVAATSRAHAQGLLDGLKVTVIGGVGEEAHSPGARHLAATMPAPDACIIGEPGAWESVVLGYKGSAQWSHTHRQPNTHGAGQQPPAPQIAVELWNTIAAWCDEWNGERTREFDRLTPTLRGFSSSNNGLEQEATLNISVRLPPDFVGDFPSFEFVNSFYDAMIDKYRIANFTFNGGFAEPPMPAYRCEKNTALVRSLLAGVRAAGGTPRFKVKTGTADMNVVGPVWNCQMAAYGPGDSSLDHTPEEHIALAEYGRAIDALARALGAFAAQARGAATS